MSTNKGHMASEWQVNNQAGIEFHPDWQGKIPPLRDSSKTEECVLTIAGRYGELSPGECEELRRYLQEFDLRFFEAAVDSNGLRLYHRPCDGGAVKKVGAGLSCRRCRDVEEVIPPDFLV